MIRLFDSKETNFNHCKWVLSEVISCYVTETTDGIFDLDLVYPLEDNKNLSQYLVNGNIIKSPISETDPRGEQLFTIRKRNPNTKEKTVTIYAQAKARRDLDLNMVLGLEVPAGKTRKEACQMLLSKCMESHNYYIGNLDVNPNTSINLGLEESTGNVINYLDISGISPRKGFLDESENSIFKAYGGEIIYNNFEINMVDERGNDHNFEIRSGKNLEELQQDIDDTDVENFATAILPCSSDGVYLPNNEIIYSSNVNTLGKRFKKVVFDDVNLVDDTQEALDIVYLQLRERVQKLFDNGLDKIKINNTINFVQLANTEEYKDYKILEKCEIGNNVTVKYFKRDDESQTPYISAVGRVIKIKFNVLKGKIEEVEIGDIKKQSIVSTITSIATTATTADTKSNTNAANIKKVKKYATDSINNLQVTMEARDNEIELSVTNLADNTTAQFLIQDGKISEKVSNDTFNSYRIQTADLIDQKVSRGSDFSTQIEQSATAIIETIQGVTDNKTIFDSSGFRVVRGGFVFEDDNGDEILAAYTGGGVQIGDNAWSKSMTMSRVYFGNRQMISYFYLSNITVDTELDMDDNNIYTGGTIYTVDLETSGNKNCVQDTINFGKRLINAYETCDYYFGDIGSGVIENGDCLIHIDPVFQECINTDIEYHVFTQVYNGLITKLERYPNYFIVYGEDNTKFSWELKAKRKGFENNRLELSKNQ
jgi:phage minor structural protein, N-terminal region